MSDWFVWNFGTILLWSMVGGMTWIMCQSKELRSKVKSPILIGLAASLLGALEIGVASIVSAGLYMLFLYIFRYWYVKLKGKEFEGFEIENDMEEKSSTKIEIVDDQPKVVSINKKSNLKSKVKKIEEGSIKNDADWK